MRTRLLTLIAVLCTLQFADDNRLSPRFRTVYIMPMTNSLDEHLASRLTSNRVLWVVLEPASADAVLTNTLDDNFWTWLARNYPATADSATAAKNHGSPQLTANPCFRQDRRHCVSRRSSKASGALVYI